MNITVDLPWPPTINTYWRRNGARYFISKRGQDYREHVMKVFYPYIGLFVAEDKIKVAIDAFPPDKRKRDLDNLFKSVLDSIQASGLYVDDNQIDELSIRRMPWNEAKIVVSISRLD